MKTITTFTATDLRLITEAIFFTRMESNWQKEWELLLNENGEMITDIEEAIQFVRSHKTLSEWGTGLATMSQAKIENAQWDNL